MEIITSKQYIPTRTRFSSVDKVKRWLDFDSLSTPTKHFQPTASSTPKQTIDPNAELRRKIAFDPLLQRYIQFCNTRSFNIVKKSCE